MGEASEQDIVAIVSKFVEAAPAGEYNDIVADVKSLVGDDAIIDGCLPGIARTYNVENVVGVSVEGSKKKAPLCRAGEIDETRYIDPHTNQVIEVDHVKLEVVSVRAIDDSERCAAAEDFRESLMKALTNYTEEHFKEPVFGVFAKQNENGQSVISLVINGTRVSPKNFLSGRWRSIVDFTLGADNSSAKVSGGLNVLVHYYEDGNVQLRGNKDVAGQIDFSSADAFGGAAIKFLEATENKYSASLAAEYTSLQEGAFKNLRKKIPFIQQRFQWQNISKYSLARELARDK